MNKMQILVSSVVAAGFLIAGCGSGGNDSENSQKQEVTQNASLPKKDGRAVFTQDYLKGKSFYLADKEAKKITKFQFNNDNTFTMDDSGAVSSRAIIIIAYIITYEGYIQYTEPNSGKIAYIKPLLENNDSISLVFSYDKTSLANINEANQFFYHILAKAQAYVNSITVVDTKPAPNLQVSGFSCDAPAIDIGASGGTYNRLGVFKDVETYEKCPNQPEISCSKFSLENGALKVEAKLDMIDEDTCQVLFKDVKFVGISKIDTQTTLPIKTDSKGRYIEEMASCDESGEEVFINSLPANIEQNAVLTQSFRGGYNQTEDHYVVKENGGYMQYSKISKNGLSQISKVSCEFDGTVKTYFKGNTAVFGNIVTTRIK